MNKQTVKTILTTIVLTMALLHGPYFYYFTSGFGKLIPLVPFCAIGFLLTIILAVKILKDRSSNTKYHIAGLALIIVAGISLMLFGDMEDIDFKLRMNERLGIIDQIKKGTLKSNHIPDEFFEISNGGNDINFYKNPNGTVSVEFYIDRGFIDHASVFRYTDSESEIRHLDEKTKSSDRDTSVKKLAENWYRVGY
jgi:hypothetical protein